MTTFLATWAICMTLACFVITGVVVVADIRTYRRGHRAEPTPTPQILEQRQPTSAAAVVSVSDPVAFEAFLAELIVTAHVEEALS